MRAPGGFVMRYAKSSMLAVSVLAVSMLSLAGLPQLAAADEMPLKVTPYKPSAQQPVATKVVAPRRQHYAYRFKPYSYPPTYQFDGRPYFYYPGEERTDAPARADNSPYRYGYRRHFW